MEANNEDYYVNILRILFIVISIINIFFTLIILSLTMRYLNKAVHNDILLTLIAVIVDLFASFGLLFRGIFSNYSGNILKLYYNWCAFDVCVNSVLLAYSGHALCILSLEKMLLISFNIKFSLYFWIFWLFVIYLANFIQAVYLSAIGNAAVSPIELFCIFKLKAESKPFYYTLISTSIAAYSLTVTSYLILIVFCCKQCLRQLEFNVPKTKVFNEARIIISKSLLFLVPYMVLYSGKIYVWIYEWSTGTRRTWSMEYTATMLSAMTVIVNCLTVLYMNEKIKSDFVILIDKFKKIIFKTLFK
jgi:hypothetical protein